MLQTERKNNICIWFVFEPLHEKTYFYGFQTALILTERKLYRCRKENTRPYIKFSKPDELIRLFKSISGVCPLSRNFI